MSHPIDPTQPPQGQPSPDPADRESTQQHSTQQLPTYGPPAPAYGYQQPPTYAQPGYQQQYGPRPPWPQAPHGQQWGQPQYGPYAQQPYAAYPPYQPYGAPFVQPPVKPQRSIGTRTLAWLVAASVLLLAAVGVGVASRSGNSLADSTIGSSQGGLGTGSSGSSGGTGSSSNGSSGNGSTSSGSGGANGSGTTTSATSAQTVGIVHINTVLGYQGAAAAGTGLVLTSNGEILTNNHVVSGATKITVTVASTGTQYTATVVGTAPTLDLAVLKLDDASGLKTVKTDTSAVKVGDEVTGVGNAGGKGGTPSASPGVVTALDQTITATDESGSGAETLHDLIQTNADIQAGDSGGALYDADNEVIGINTAASADKGSGTAGQTSASEPEAYAIPISSALGVVKQIETGKETSVIHIGYPAFLGVAVSPQSAAGGATVAGVVQGSPAETAGMKEGDIITAVNGQGVDSTTLTDALGALEPGDQVSITWTDSAGQSHTATVTLIQGPAD